MDMEKSSLKEWLIHGEWLVFMGTLIVMFMFVHNENVHLTERLDNHTMEIHKRIDTLHKEFYELLKEMRK